MSKKHEFLDFTKQHTLTEQECERITFFRSLSKTRQQVIMQSLFSLLLADHKKKHPLDGGAVVKFYIWGQIVTG